MLKRLDGRLIPDTAPDRMTDYEAMRIHVYRDQQVEAARGPPVRDLRRQPPRGATAEPEPLYARRRSHGPRRAPPRSTSSPSPATGSRCEVLERVAPRRWPPNKGRKSLILVSEGFIYDPNLDEFKGTMQASRRSNAAIYFLDTRGPGGHARLLDRGVRARHRHADIGAAFLDRCRRRRARSRWPPTAAASSVKNTNDLARGIERIADESRSYYLIGYNPTNAAPRRPLPQDPGEGGGPQGAAGPRAQGLLRAARRAASAAAKPRSAAPIPQIQAALDSPYDEKEVPLRMTVLRVRRDAARQGQRAGGGGRRRRGVRLRGEGRAASWTPLEFLLVVAHRETGEFFRYDQKVEMKLLPETRERLAQTWFPIVARLRAGARRLPGQDRRARQEQRPHRHRGPRVRGAGPERVPGLDAGAQRHAAGRTARTRATAAARASLARRAFAPGRHALRAASRSTARPRTRRRACPGSAPATLIRRADGSVVTARRSVARSRRRRWASSRAWSARRSRNARPATTSSC